MRLHGHARPLEYQGYDYETVQIGEQCWFAENLRAESYRDGGELIKVNASTGVADYEGQGAMAVYESVSAVQGALYSLPVVLYDGGICPSGWKVPHRTTGPTWSRIWACLKMRFLLLDIVERLSFWGCSLSQQRAGQRERMA